MNPWLAILLVLALLAGLMFAVRGWQRRAGPHPELARKLIHVGMGLIALGFPWLFRERWPVLVLATGAVAFLLAVRWLRPAREQLGTVLGSVTRSSFGDVYFPVAVAILFWLARGDRILYGVPVAILTLADAVGALIGVRYGFFRYATDDGEKSAEGSAAFFFAAFLVTHAPLLLFTATGRAESLFIGALMGFLLMLMEAISWRGLDNLFVPLVSFVALKTFLLLDPAELAVRLAVLAALVAFMGFWRRRTRLTWSAAVGGALVLYTSWAVGDTHWLIAPAMVLVGYSLLCPLEREPVQATHTVHAVACVASTGLIWLFLARGVETVNVIYPYGVAYAAHLGMVALAHFWDGTRGRPVRWHWLKSTAMGYAIPAAPYLFVWRENPNVMLLAALALGFVGLAVLLFGKLQPQMDNCPTDAPRWVRQGCIAALVSLLAFAAISAVEPWSTAF